MKLQIILLSAVFTLATTVTHAQPYPGGSYTPYAPKPSTQVQDPRQMLKERLKMLRDFLVEGGGDEKARLYTFLQDEIAPYFDFDRMAAWVARPYYRKMSDRERTRLRERLQETLLKALASELGTYKQPLPRVDFYRPRPVRAKMVDVSARVRPVYGYPTRLTFRLYLGNEGWKVINVSRDGNSAIYHLRQQFLTAARR